MNSQDIDRGRMFRGDRPNALRAGLDPTHPDCCWLHPNKGPSALSTAPDRDTATIRPMKVDLPSLAELEDDERMLDDLNPAPRLLMGPGPINADPRVLRALATQLLGQFDPQFRAYMKETMALYRRVFETENRWTLAVDGTARAAIEAVMASVVEPGDRVLVLSFGRFGQLKTEIARRVGADVRVLETAWGSVFRPEQVEAALKSFSPKLVAVCQGDTSTTMA